MPIRTPLPEVVNLFKAVNEYKVWQHDNYFPFMDTFLFYRSALTNKFGYDATMPEYFDNRAPILKWCAHCGQEWKQYLHQIIYVKQTDKGFHIPNKDYNTIIVPVKGEITILRCESIRPLLDSMAVYDYDIYNWSRRGIVKSVCNAEPEQRIIGYTPKKLVRLDTEKFTAFHAKEGTEFLFMQYAHARQS